MRGFAQVLSHICTHAFKFRVISRTITCVLQRSFYLAFVWGSQTRHIANSLRTQIYRCITQSYLHLLPSSISEEILFKVGCRAQQSEHILQN